MDPILSFKKEVREYIENIGNDEEIKKLSSQLSEKLFKAKYSYVFSWLGRPIIQYPQDLMAMQEIIFKVQPDLIIETGIAHGGSIIFYASMLELIGGDGTVVGVDIDIRKHNRDEIEQHRMFKRIKLIEGSSISEETIEKVRLETEGKKRIMVVLDSMHTHEHVLAELNLYSQFVTPGSYLAVFDTIVEDLPEGSSPNRPWEKGNNPKTAVWEFIKKNKRFVIDEEYDKKLALSCTHNGYLKCMS